ncbi:hypothetical protein J6590_002413 [Homalodisca vitripennis]|nr:hypothetical protein J6590_002413 [Homalodisca vitripennis]
MVHVVDYLQNLDIHLTTARVQRKHSQEGSSFVCDNCGKIYSYQRSLNLHRRLECGKHPSFKCPLCEKRCHQRGNLTLHVRKHHPEHFQNYQSQQRSSRLGANNTVSSRL